MNDVCPTVSVPSAGEGGGGTLDALEAGARGLFGVDALLLLHERRGGLRASRRRTATHLSAEVVHTHRATVTPSQSHEADAARCSKDPAYLEPLPFFQISEANRPSDDLVERNQNLPLRLW